MLPDNLGEVTDSTIDELWRKGTDPQRERLNSMYRNTDYLSANTHPSGLVRYRDGNTYHNVGQKSRETWIWVNLMKNNLVRLVDALSGRTPQFMPIEDTADDYAVSAGNLAKRILQAKYTKNWGNDLRKQTLWHAYVGGCVGIWVDWDANKQTTTETMTTLNDMTFEPSSKLASTARWGIKQQILPSNVVRSMFPAQFEQGAPGTDGTNAAWLSVNQGIRSSPVVDVAAVRTLYVRPSSLHPQGGFFTSADGKLLEQGVWPYPWKDRLNVCVLRQQPFDQIWWGGSGLDDCTPIQAYINQLWSYFLMAMRDVSAPILEAPGNMRRELEALDGRPGQTAYRQAGSAQAEGMRYVAPPTWQPDVFNALELSKNVLDDLMGMADVLRGRNAPNIESGAGVVALQQAALGDINSMSQSEAWMWGQIGTMCIDLHKMHVQESRKWLISESGAKISRSWDGNDLGPVSSVEVPSASLDPAEKQLITQISLEGMAAGRFGLDVVVKARQLDTLEQLLEEVHPHELAAQKENEQFAGFDDDIRTAASQNDMDAVRKAQNQVWPPSDADEHRTHIQSHRIFKSSSSYRRLHPLTKQVFDAHLETHQKELQREMMNMMKMRQAMGQAPEAQAAA